MAATQLAPQRVVPARGPRQGAAERARKLGLRVVVGGTQNAAVAAVSAPASRLPVSAQAPQMRARVSVSSAPVTQMPRAATAPSALSMGKALGCAMLLILSLLLAAALGLGVGTVASAGVNATTSVSTQADNSAVSVDASLVQPR